MAGGGAMVHGGSVTMCTSRGTNHTQMEKLYFHLRTYAIFDFRVMCVGLLKTETTV